MLFSEVKLFCEKYYVLGKIVCEYIYGRHGVSSYSDIRSPYDLRTRTRPWNSNRRNSETNKFACIPGLSCVCLWCHAVNRGFSRTGAISSGVPMKCWCALHIIFSVVVNVIAGQRRFHSQRAVIVQRSWRSGRHFRCSRRMQRCRQQVCSRHIKH